MANSQNDFRARMDEMERRRRATMRIVVAIQLMVATLIVVTPVLLVLYPEAVGAWIGRLLKGVRS